MSLKIRLSRGGAKKRPFYRIVVADSRSPRDGRFIEKIGTYDPMVAKDHPDRLRLDKDRAQHWLSVGAKPSDRVSRFLADAELMGARVLPKQTKKDQPRAKTLERREAAAAKAAEASASKEEASVEETPAEAPAAEEVSEQAPAEETPAEAPAAEEGSEQTPAEEPAAEETAAEATPAEKPATEAEPEAEKTA